ncbi:hypothetical protein D9C73_021488 [Collichthys lucidus]|uniref:Uncharacterized protein n=1 Tax=Collichthys lucidus TaxID=240159 RepID=A0A4U5VGI8_COLLU|nr:hypothetical protein D9C73_021488 [Collichthys lucidus]
MSADVQSEEEEEEEEKEEEEEGCGLKGRCYQFIMELLLRVMKKTWLLPPERTEAKKTCRNKTGGGDSLPSLTNRVVLELVRIKDESQNG